MIQGGNDEMMTPPTRGHLFHSLKPIDQSFVKEIFK